MGRWGSSGLPTCTGHANLQEPGWRRNRWRNPFMKLINCLSGYRGSDFFGGGRTESTEKEPANQQLWPTPYVSLRQYPTKHTYGRRPDSSWLDSFCSLPVASIPLDSISCGSIPPGAISFDSIPFASIQLALIPLGPLHRADSICCDSF